MSWKPTAAPMPTTSGVYWARVARLHYDPPWSLGDWEAIDVSAATKKTLAGFEPDCQFMPFDHDYWLDWSDDSHVVVEISPRIPRPDEV